MTEATHDVPRPPTQKLGLSVVSLLVLGLVSGGVAIAAIAAGLRNQLLAVVTGGGLALGIYLAMAPRVASQ